MKRYALSVLALVLGSNPAPAAERQPNYTDIVPLLQARCVICHSGANAPLGLRLDTYAGLKKGSQNGAVIEPGQPVQSELVRRVRGTSLPRMPLTGPPYLTENEIKLIENWITAGAPGPTTETEAASSVTRRSLPGPGQPVRFDDVEPIVLKRCVKCHKDNGKMGPPPEGLRLTNYAQVLAGGERVVVVPGSPGASELYRRIVGHSRPRMPFDGPPYLAPDEIRVIKDWIAQGATDASGRRAPIPVGARVRFEGTLTGRWEVDGLALSLARGVRIKKAPAVGDRVEVRGYVTRDGSIEVTRLRRR